MDSFSSASAPPLKKGFEAPPAVGNGDETQTGTLRVFLVEDSPSIRERLSDYLSEPGKVEIIGFATTEVDAARELRGQSIDVAIVDLNLKEGTGIGVIEAVRAGRPSAPPTIIVLTNYAFPEFEAACRAAGADYFFDKSTQVGAVKVLLQSIRRDIH
jgi:two-component system OmpR family response regulator